MPVIGAHFRAYLGAPGATVSGGRGQRAAEAEADASAVLLGPLKHRLLGTWERLRPEAAGVLPSAVELGATLAAQQGEAAQLTREGLADVVVSAPRGLPVPCGADSIGTLAAGAGGAAASRQRSLGEGSPAACPAVEASSGALHERPTPGGTSAAARLPAEADGSAPPLGPAASPSALPTPALCSARGQEAALEAPAPVAT